MAVSAVANGKIAVARKKRSPFSEKRSAFFGETAVPVAVSVTLVVVSVPVEAL